MTKKTIITIACVALAALLAGGIVGYFIIQNIDLDDVSDDTEIAELIIGDETTEDSLNIPDVDEVIPAEDNANQDEQPAQVGTSGPEPQSYTNPFFPNFALNYDDSWEFDTTTSAGSYQEYPDLLHRTITLTKGDTIIRTQTQLPIPAGCGPFDEMKSPVSRDIQNSGISRYDWYGDEDYIYIDSIEDQGLCGLSGIFIVDTNIPSEGRDRLQTNEKGNLTYWMQTYVTGSEYLEEADQIIADSTFE